MEQSYACGCRSSHTPRLHWGFNFGMCSLPSPLTSDLKAWPDLWPAEVIEPAAVYWAKVYLLHPRRAPKYVKIIYQLAHYSLYTINEEIGAKYGCIFGVHSTVVPKSYSLWFIYLFIALFCHYYRNTFFKNAIIKNNGLCSCTNCKSKAAALNRISKSRDLPVTLLFVFCFIHHLKRFVSHIL